MQGIKHNPYIAPEVFTDERFNASLFSEEFSKADVFSLGMLMVHLVCAMYGENFARFAKYNVIQDAQKTPKNAL